MVVCTVLVATRINIRILFVKNSTFLRYCENTSTARWFRKSRACLRKDRPQEQNIKIQNDHMKASPVQQHGSKIISHITKPWHTA